MNISKLAVIPTAQLIAVALIAALLLRWVSRRVRDYNRGWRVGHRGHGNMYYEERRDGKWVRLDVPGELLIGTPHHIIYFKSMQIPTWANGRRAEIIGRIQGEFRQPGYAHDI